MQLRSFRIATMLFCVTTCLLLQPGFAQAEHDGKLQVLLLGDSTTIGSVCRITNPTGPHLEDVLRLLLATDKELPPTNVINQGRDGEFIHGLLTGGRYDKDVSKLPGIDYIFFRYGLNDRARREDFPNNFPKDIHDLIVRLQKDFPQATIIPMTVIPYLTPEADAQINSLVRKAAADDKLPLFDIYPRYQDELTHGYNMLNYRRCTIDKIPEQHRTWIQPFIHDNSVIVMDNQLDAHFRDVSGWFSDRHPNLAGYHVIADETAKYLAKLIKEKKAAAK
ncbi:MAG: SGNH/GDSL hydrolase family protein [Planctomycetota bacterium]